MSARLALIHPPRAIPRVQITRRSGGWGLVSGILQFGVYLSVGCRVIGTQPTEGSVAEGKIRPPA